MDYGGGHDRIGITTGVEMPNGSSLCLRATVRVMPPDSTEDVASRNLIACLKVLSGSALRLTPAPLDCAGGKKLNCRNGRSVGVANPHGLSGTAV